MEDGRYDDKARVEDEVARFKSRLAATQSELEVLRAVAAEAEALKAARDEERRGVIALLEEMNETTARISMAEREWVATFDAIESPIFVHDRELRVVRANKAYQKLAGLKFKEFIGRPYYEIFPRLDGPIKTCQDTMSSGVAAEDELTIVSLGRVFRTRYYTVGEVAGDALYAHFMEDVTEARRAEQRIREEMEITSNLLAFAAATARSTDLAALIDHAVECVNGIMKNDACIAYLWDPSKKELRAAAQRGLRREDDVVFRASPYLGQLIKAIVEERRPFVRRGGELMPWIAWADTTAVMPLKGRAGLLGAIVVVYGGPRELTEREMKVMAGFSDQLSVAIEQARLYRDSVEKSLALSHQLKTIEVMHEIDSSILSTLDSGTILDVTTRMVGTLIPCDRVSVALADKEKRQFTMAAGYGASVKKGAVVPFDETSTVDVIETGSPQYTSDLSAEPERKRLEEVFLKEGFLSHIRVPLKVKGDVIGVLVVGSKKAAAYTAEDLSTLEKLASQMTVALENARLIDDLNDLFTSTVSTLSSALDAKSKWTAGHSERVTGYAIAIGKELNLSRPELRDLELAGLLHDIGKIGTYEAVLDKPGRLTDDELQIMRMHAGKGGEILAPIKQLKAVIPAVRGHHERYDGSGYPDGLKGEEIPPLARILALADAVDAMGADRPYRKGRTYEEVVAEVKRCSGTHFDPKVAEAFLKVYKPEPA